MKSVAYMSERLFLMLKPLPNVAVISITEPDREIELQKGWGELLSVQFCDAEYDQDMLDRRPSFSPEAKRFPCRSTGEVLRQFIDTFAANENITQLIVHCHAGRRRSAAVAKYAAQKFNVEFDHEYTGYNKTVYSLMMNPECFHVRPAKKQGFFGRLISSF